MVVFSIVDVKMFVIRVVVFFLVVGVLISLFAALGEIQKGTEVDRRLNELGEAMLTSEFTIARAVFDPSKRSPSIGNRSIIDISGSNIEPLKFCNNVAYFEFSAYSDGEYKPLYSFGTEHVVLTDRSWEVWIKNESGIMPGRMRITIGDDSVLKFLETACAIEHAWLYKMPIELKSAMVCRATAICTMRYEDGVLCSEETEPAPFPRIFGPYYTYCRYLGMPLLFPPIIEGGGRTVSVYPIKDVPGAEQSCRSPTTFLNDEERNQFNVKSVVLCVS